MAVIYDLTKRTGGGGDTMEEARKCLMGTWTSLEDDEITTLRPNALFGYSTLTTVKLHGLTTIGSYAMNECRGVTALAFPSLTSAARSWEFCTNLEVMDMGASVATLANACFNGCSKLATLILRNTSRVALGNVNVFNGTPFKNGGTGGTIYIPKSLYDHLGDGTANDYKAATNWSTINGYGTIAWAQIEGSAYESAYGDGTPIPTT